MVNSGYNFTIEKNSLYMTSRFLSIFTFTLLSYFASAQVIQSGPMPGYASMNSVGIWLQLTDSADV